VIAPFVLPAQVARAAAAPSRLAFREPDAELLRKVFAETRAATSPERPSITAYPGVWIRELFKAIGRMFSAVLPPGAAEVAQLVALLVLGAAIALLAVSILRRVQARRRRGAPVPRLAWTEEADAAPLSRGRAEWRREVDARLARGDVAGALEALWWWLAASVTPEGAPDPSWTTRELLARARRADLISQGAALDTLMYGPLAPTAGGVAACLARLEESLA
jgi:hypothetical protein